MDELIYGGTSVTVLGTDETFLVAENMVIVDSIDAIMTKPILINGVECVRLMFTFKGNVHNGEQAVAFTALVDYKGGLEMTKMARALLQRVPLEYRES